MKIASIGIPASGASLLSADSAIARIYNSASEQKLAALQVRAIGSGLKKQISGYPVESRFYARLGVEHILVARVSGGEQAHARTRLLFGVP